MELLADARLHGGTWAHEVIAQTKADVESLLQSTGSSGYRSDPTALGVPDPIFDEHGGVDLWQRIYTPENWVHEARRGDGPQTGKAPHFTGLAVEYTPVGRALVFVATWQLAADHPNFRSNWAGEEQAELAAAEAHDAAGPGPSLEFLVPSDSELGLQPGVAEQCAGAFIAVSRGHHVVAAARSELGPANPDEVCARGGGVTEIVSPVRAQIHEAPLALEVNLRQVEDRGFQ